MFAAVFPPAARRTNGAAMWAKARRGNGTFFYRKLVPQRRGAPCAWSLSKPLSQGLARATWRLRGEAAVPQLTAMVTAARATTSRAAVPSRTLATGQFIASNGRLCKGGPRSCTAIPVSPKCRGEMDVHSIYNDFMHSFGRAACSVEVQVADHK